jgi:putative ABC transport system permease protein
MSGAADIKLWQLGAAYVFAVIVFAIIKIRGISREKEIIIATIRMTVQLVLVGFILVYIFENINPIVTVGIVLIMEVFAVYDIFKRVKLDLTKEIKKTIAISMSIGTLISLIFFIFVVVGVVPWYNPRYFIPLAGMLIGNSMTGISLGVSRLVDGVNTQRNMVESALMLGATPKAAIKKIADKAFDAAIMPTINSMLGMGIIFLPGMMTGQILAGASPLIAIKYQIAIMMGIFGSVSLTVILFIQLGYKTFFNKKDQLILND